MHPSRYQLEKPLAPDVLLPVTDNLIFVQRHQTIQSLLKAIEEQQAVILRPYHSVSEQSVRDWMVEPYALKHQEKYLLAYEPVEGVVRPFKIDRIGSVVLLKEGFSQEPSVTDMDIFGWAGEAGISVKLRLSSLAYRLLIEEYPHAMHFVSREAERATYRLEHEVFDFKGIGRFVLGLPGEVEVLEPEALRDYVRAQAQRSWEG